MNKATRTIVTALLAASGVFLVAGHSASASTLLATYDLLDHPDGGAKPPQYGLRLDGISGNGSIWTFSFEDDKGLGSHTGASSMKMKVFDDKLELFGQVYGGKDTGTGWGASDQGLWNLNFT
ncbi:MAG: hypothetical protein ACREUA_02760 [Burkholderiales bacterium]